MIAYSYYKENESAQAITAADRFLKLNPNHPNADYVQYLKGLATFNDDLGLFGRFLGIDPSRLDPKSMREAFEVFRELTARWPDSKYAPDATLRMNYLINAMAQSEVNIARFYFQRGAYVAAIQRSQGAVRDFQRSPAAEEALTIIVRSYQALSLPELAADAERVLKQGVGRLIRDDRDRGVLMILDDRLLTKSYGRIVLDSLPPFARTRDADAARAFLAEVTRKA